jgi:hypothetical protein
VRVAQYKIVDGLARAAQCDHPSDRQLTFCEPVSVRYPTGLRHAKTEIGKRRAETGAAKRRVRTEILKIHRRRPDDCGLTHGNIDGWAGGFERAVPVEQTHEGVHQLFHHGGCLGVLW